jgi:hypothetical protein
MGPLRAASPEARGSFPFGEARMENRYPASLDGSDQHPVSIVQAAWLGAVLAVMVASQIIRMHQPDAGSWIFWDYAGRVGGLMMLAVLPTTRVVAFRLDRRQMALWQIAVWIAGICVALRLSQWLGYFINKTFPATIFGVYPRTDGWLHFFDLAFGLALVAVSEEIIFRRCTRHVLQPLLGDGYVAVIAASLVFGCYHWWAGLGNVVLAVIIGTLLMLMFRQSVALWPVVLAHYFADFITFVR